MTHASGTMPRLQLRADDAPGWIADGRRRVTVAEAVVLHGETDAAAVFGATRLALDALPEAAGWELRAELLSAEQLVSAAASSELAAILARIDRVAGMCPSAPDVLDELAATRRRITAWRERVEDDGVAFALLATVRLGAER